MENTPACGNFVPPCLPTAFRWKMAGGGFTPAISRRATFTWAASDTEILARPRRRLPAAGDPAAFAPAEVRRIGFPWSEAMVERSRRSAGATWPPAGRRWTTAAPRTWPAAPTTRFRDRGEGFCVFNDAAIAALAMRAEGRAKRVAIIDCDVHQGNGTAAILARQPDCFTFSLHGARNFPLREGEASDLDVELPDDTGDTGYLDALDAAPPPSSPAAGPSW